MLHKKHGKDWLTVCYYKRYHSERTIFRLCLMMNSKDGIDFE